MRAFRGLRAGGFTLVELMVVIMIIALMAVITLFIARNFTAKAYQTSALNTMRQVATANVSYSMDNNGDINVLLDPGETRGDGLDKISNSFWGRLIPYLFDGVDPTSDLPNAEKQLVIRLNALFGTDNCHKMTKTFQKGSQIYHDDSDLPVPFAFNEHVYESNEYIKTQSFDDSAKIIHMSYGYHRFNEQDGQTYAPIPMAGKSRTNNIDWFSNKSAVFCFLDGHVEILTPPVPDRRFKDPTPP